MNAHSQRAFEWPRNPVSKGAVYVIGLTAVCYLIQHVFLADFFRSGDMGSATSQGRLHGQGLLLFSLSDDVLTRGYIWQLWSYALLHDDFMHLVLNMLIVGFMGREVEERFGLRSFLLLYVLCSALAGLGWLALGGFGGDICFGASGAAFGLIGAFAAAFPRRQITLLFLLVIPITMTGRMLAVVSAGASFFLMMGHGGNVAHSAHLAGLVAGFLLTHYWLIRRPQTHTRSSARRGRPRLHVLPYDESSQESWQRERDPEPFTEEDVDRILEKIRASGMRSLSKRERDALDWASRR